MRSVCLIAVILISLYFLPRVLSQPSIEKKPAAEQTETTITVNAKGRGFPRVNFIDGTERKNVSEAQSNGSAAQSLAAADFDSDGTADLIIAESNGNLQFYRGNPESIYPQSLEAAERHRLGTFSEDAFLPTDRSFPLSVAPDFLAAGDFNADGHQDVLAARKNDDALYLAAGNGAGSFAAGQRIPVGGAITALATGEIGRADGQTDVAVAINGRKAQLLVYEHPTGAFARAPETIALPSPATDIVLGFLESDGFADIAVAGGNRLTIVRGRGQIYPWDMIESEKLKRPAPIVDSRAMPFTVAALEIGYFTERRGQSLVMLSDSGELLTLDTNFKPNPRRIAPDRLALFAAPQPGITAGSERFSAFSQYVEPTRRLNDPSELLEHPEIIPEGITDVTAYQVELQNKRQARREALTPAERALKDAADKEKAQLSKERTKIGFLKSLSPAPVDKLASWELRSIAADARLSAISTTPSVKRMTKVRVSDSGRDELAFIDSTSNQIHLMIRENPLRSRDPRANELISFESTGAPVALLPMRLNMDALTDLVVLRAGSPQPTTIMTAPSATFLVTTLSDEDNGSCGASCSLREAINAANNSSGADSIEITVSGTILPTSPLPRIRSAITFNSFMPTSPVVEIRGTNAGEGANGLEINAANVVVRGLAIGGFQHYQPDPEEPGAGGHGITIYNFAGQTHSAFNIIEGNYLGIGRSGLDIGNEATGLQIFDSDNNTIGGTTSTGRNVISANGEGNIRDSPVRASGIAVVDGRFIVIRGNYVGTNAAGTEAVGNSDGIMVAGSNIQYGGDAAGAMNVVSGNRHLVTLPPDPNPCYGTGIRELTAINETTGEWITHDNTFQGNRVGTNAAGTAAIPNCRTGIYTSPRHSAIIGSITPGGRNLVSGNDEGGIYCTLSPPLSVVDFLQVRESAMLMGDEVPEGSCMIRGNNVGTNAAGTAAIPNTYNHLFLRPGMNYLNLGGGLAIDNSSTYSSIGDPGGTTPDACTGFCNLASGETTTETGAVTAGDPGIYAHGDGSVGIFNNYAGVNITGTAALPNGYGIGGSNDTNNSTLIGAVASGPGGTRVLLGNLASGNRNFGIDASVHAYDSLVFVQANRIGTDRTGMTAIPNGAGLEAGGTEGVVIVGGLPDEGNLIAGNTGDGIFFWGTADSTTTRNNLIGVNANRDPLGNGGNGFLLTGTYDYIGSEGAGNVIANNGGNGVLVRRRLGSSTDARGNSIRYNTIYNNGGLGIDLSADTTTPVEPDGVTPNDCLDADTGANMLQNYPILAAPSFNGNGTVSIEGALKSVPNRTFTLDFYANNSIDPTSFGEGQTHIGSKSVTTDNDGFATFLFTSEVTVASGLKITATASDFDGNTSEFSCAAGMCAGRSGKLSEDELRQLGETSSCTPEIIVNITTDEPDNSPNNEFCDVDLNTPGSQCSLRGAIATAQGAAYPAFTVIKFNIPGEGARVITLTGEDPLPAIDERVYIDATTQPGWVDKPIVEVRGNGTHAYGLNFAPGSGNSGVRGLAFNRFATAIKVQTNNNTITGNYFGLSADGAAAGTTAQNGIGLDVSGNQNKLQFNVISNNNLGIVINGTGNTVSNNKIGTSVPGGGSIPNVVGVSLGGNSSSNLIEDNQISGNGNAGVTLEGNATANIIAENKIGTSADGTAAVANKYGISIVDNASTNDILNNQISGNTDYGIYLTGDSVANLVQDNKIGTNADGTARVPNGIGIYNKSNGTNNQFAQNLISGNSLIGVYITETAHHTLILNNKIGTNDDGTAAIYNPVGIQLDGGTGDIQIEENTISGNTVTGVVIRGNSANNLLIKNQIGTNADGNAALANLHGVDILGEATANKLKFNTISGNTTSGVSLSQLSTGTLIQGNKIGTNKLGNAEIPNNDGIKITRTDATSEISENRIVENLISGNTTNGVLISGTMIFNEISLNKIGTDETGNEAIENKFGIQLGGDIALTQILGNTISGNTEAGIYLKDNASDNTISQNKIGTNHAGDARISQLDLTKFGICISGRADRNTVSDNLIAGLRVGVLVGNTIGTYAPEGLREEIKNNRPINNGSEDSFIVGNHVYHNTVGLNAAKSAKIENYIGIALGENALSNTIGRGTLGLHNLIAGSSFAGIFIGTTNSFVPDDQRPRINIIYGNVLGISGDGTKRTIPNRHGIYLQKAYNNRIGGTFDPINGIMGSNIILASTFEPFKIIESDGNVIEGNIFGELPPFFEPLNAGKTDLLQVAPVSFVEDYGNGGGILIEDGSSNNLIGGETVDLGNIITGNAGSGISFALDAGNGNKISLNRFYGNAGAGIDLGNDGLTPNDPDDADSGPNNLQNYPEIVSRQIVNDELVIGFKVDSAPAHSDYGTNGILVAFFKADPSGEGEKFLGSAFYTVADFNGSLVGTKTVNLGDINTLGITSADRITATATDASGNTSEFTPTLAPTAANVSISGRVSTAEGAGISRAQLILTDANGNTRTMVTNSFGVYHFEAVEVGATYTLTVSHKKYRFEQAVRILQVLDELTDIDFIGTD